MIDGLSHLLTMRKQGLRPKSLWLSIGVPYVQPKYEQDFTTMELVAHGSISKDDFRPFIGMPVTFYVNGWTDLASECLERLKQFAEEITVVSPDYGANIGFFWSKTYGELENGVIGWIQQFMDATKTLCKTEEEVKERLRLEAEARAHVPNIQEYINGNLS